MMESILKHMKRHPDDCLRGHADQPYGFAAYVRKAFEQKKTINKTPSQIFFFRQPAQNRVGEKHNRRSGAVKPVSHARHLHNS